MSDTIVAVKEPTISVDRMFKSFALFDGWNIIGRFEKYETEEAAIATGMARFAAIDPAAKPKVVYPRIKSLTYTYEKPRRVHRDT
jgi:hypothetical protein